MVYTTHAIKRCQQRAVPEVLINLILKVGDEFYARRHCLIVTARSRASKKELLEEIKKTGLKNTDGWDKAYVVVNENDVVLTAGHRTKRIHTQINSH